MVTPQRGQIGGRSSSSMPQYRPLLGCVLRRRLVAAIELDRVHVLWPRVFGKLIRSEGALRSDRDRVVVRQRLALSVAGRKGFLYARDEFGRDEWLRKDRI